MTPPPWYPLEEARTMAPTAAGVYQVKLPQLIDYPHGKSAMIHYGVSGEVRAALTALAAAHPGAAWLARHLEERPADPEALLRELVDRFRRRFGAPPTLPEARS